MSTRRALQPLSPLYGSHHNARNGTNGQLEMAHNDPQALGGNVEEVLSDLENDTEADDFDRLMMQNARDERRMNDALQGKVQAFRKARVHPRVGVTLENLERHNAKNNGGASASASAGAGAGAGAHVSAQSPPSSSGSVRSDPAVQPPSGWGRKARVKRNWMRTITAEEHQTPVDADRPPPSVDDSPLSHKKGSRPGTPSGPQQTRQDDDWSFDLDQASVIASTPYFPRNTALEDIRQREISSMREQGVATNRLDQVRESSPEEKRRTRPSSAKSTNSQANGREAGSPERMRKSWQWIGKSQPVTGEGVENSPVVVYNSRSETTGRASLAGAQPGTARPHKRDNSHDLLRRLARASNSPSPEARPHSATEKQPDSSQTMVTEASPVQAATGRAASTTQPPKELHSNETAATAPEPQPQPPQIKKEAPVSRASSQDTLPQVDATPMPEGRSILNPKTPVVTGAWIDTPKPATALRPNEQTRPRSKSPEKRNASKSSPRKQAPAEKQTQPLPEAIRPNLPRSALEAIVEEARAGGHRRQTDFGDSTINSLEDLITGLAGGTLEVDEDTLQGLQLPTSAPKNESERQRQQELVALHRMNDRLRTARAGIRDASRGIRRVEHQVEHGEERDENGRVVKIGSKDCPCIAAGGHQTVWKGFKSLFYDERLKEKGRRWGLTWLSLALLSFALWYAAESVACELWGHKQYASSYSSYGVRWNAPQYPFVLPTMLYRSIVQPWWRPLWSLLSFIYGVLVSCVFGSDGVASPTVQQEATTVASKVILEETILGILEDEVVR
ncbi:hypothetical protein P280DRAFT_546139 [Massarina eburnea CBS 473.64]|uniref:Uncharacterized protein n=1 Tax=Massarina eburnea CBS 473.64 TaxID=1395130 RepID=A0A6A6SAB4_9PLEO|nr:hypothetical protein P280DRAFT_546139 [Massarina eburnea CBS 473.64]